MNKAEKYTIISWKAAFKDIFDELCNIDTAIFLFITVKLLWNGVHFK